MQDSKLNASIPVESDCVDWKFVPAKGDIEAYYVYVQPIKKRARDNGEYRLIRLENGLEAILVHDISIRTAAMNLSVATGHLHDPDDMPGLARLCEDALYAEFYESDIPVDYSEHDFTDLCTKSSGSNTDFLLSTDPRTLRVVLEHFSENFRSPKFTLERLEDYIDEVDNSHHASHLNSDVWRVSSVRNILACSGHPLRRFGCGNEELLKQSGWKSYRNSIARTSPKRKKLADDDALDSNAAMVEIRKRLVGWWEKEYCARRMKLALIGKESLDELTHLIMKCSSSIPNRGKDPTPLLDQPYGKEELGKIIHVRAKTDGAYAVTITFPVPWQTPLWRVKPFNFIGHLLRYGGPGSLKSHLRKKGWLFEDVAEISARRYTAPGDFHSKLKRNGWLTDNILAYDVEVGRGVSLFEIRIELTMDGFMNYREVISACFNYFDLLREPKGLSWVQEEIMRIDELSFRFGERPCEDDLVQNITDHMQCPIPRALVVLNPTLDWNEHLIHETLDRLVIENSLIMISGQDHTASEEMGPWLTDPWHGAEYSEKKLSDDFVFSARSPNKIGELAFPQPNKFLPRNVDVQEVNVTHTSKGPTLIKRTSLTELWYKKGDRFWIPRAKIMVHAWSPFAGTTPRACVMNSIFSELVKDSLVEPTYDARCASFEYEFYGDDFGLHLEFEGYSDKIHELVKLVLETIKRAEIKKDRIAAMIEKEEARLEPYLPELVCDDCTEKFALLLKARFTSKEKRLALKEITTERLAKHVSLLLSQLKYTILVYGNVEKEDAFCLASLVEETLGAKAAPGEKVTQYRTRRLPRPCNYIWEINSAEGSYISYYCQIDNCWDVRTKAIVLLLSEILDEFVQSGNMTPIRDFLSTIRVLDVHDLGGLRIDFESRADPTYLESLTERYLTQMRVWLQAMDESQFEWFRAEAMGRWTAGMEDDRFGDEADLFWKDIQSGYYRFDSLEDRMKLMRSVTKEEVVRMFDSFVHPASPTRSKLSIHIRPQNPLSPRLSPRASEAFADVLRGAGITLDDDDELQWGWAWGPSVEEARNQWQGRYLEQLGGDEGKEAMLVEEFYRVVKKYPVEGERHAQLNPQAIYIKDVDRFRDSLGFFENSNLADTEME
ncbi:uncharacterized protein FOMMEDRAFT_156520 [Fomitiporia mediterranea MF3/22]|uniref:uncharacterized protein n=1 Tax=Fomitiporia mediterranea (strain MF3/22) TaxID=694068 RepID=UPI00044074EA|nr:uncharacterized protein FOMMEDRAFT_156520 [Fomitiporia mediterranea MF3/22]EJD03146.1 hypothetical protein FOMMEDRAFT_156520 [Fomitiporia mediterranea MF3/22]